MMSPGLGSIFGQTLLLDIEASTAMSASLDSVIVRLYSTKMMLVVAMRAVDHK